MTQLGEILHNLALVVSGIVYVGIAALLLRMTCELFGRRGGREVPVPSYAKAALVVAPTVVGIPVLIGISELIQSTIGVTGTRTLQMAVSIPTALLLDALITAVMLRFLLTINFRQAVVLVLWFVPSLLAAHAVAILVLYGLVLLLVLMG